MNRVWFVCQFTLVTSYKHIHKLDRVLHIHYHKLHRVICICIWLHIYMYSTACVIWNMQHAKCNLYIFLSKSCWIRYDVALYQNYMISYDIICCYWSHISCYHDGPNRPVGLEQNHNHFTPPLLLQKQLAILQWPKLRPRWNEPQVLWTAKGIVLDGKCGLPNFEFLVRDLSRNDERNRLRTSSCFISTSWASEIPVSNTQSSACRFPAAHVILDLFQVVKSYPGYSCE